MYIKQITQSMRLVIDKSNHHTKLKTGCWRGQISHGMCRTLKSDPMRPHITGAAFRAYKKVCIMCNKSVLLQSVKIMILKDNDKLSLWAQIVTVVYIAIQQYKDFYTALLECSKQVPNLVT